MEHFDAVVVGSGFGGSVMACRLAEAGKSVCVLERGKAYPPGSFPRSPHGIQKNFWDPSAGLYGMFNVWSFPKAGALVSAGLGGGSLIYANVHLRKDEKWFIHESPNSSGYETWVVTRQDLDPHYSVAERMLNVQKYPFDTAPFSNTAKTAAMKEAAGKLGLDWQLVPLAVSFRSNQVDGPDSPGANNPPAYGAPIHEPHGNLHGMARSTCRLCGECDIGCNYGSKNTLDYTYLSEAKRHGADIRTLAEVKSFHHDGNAWRITYRKHNSEGTSRNAQTVEVTATKLIIAAGTFGSNYLLLNNAAALPGLSDQVGRRYTGNGDLLSFLMNARNPDGSVRVLDPTFGPVITSAIRAGDTLDGNGPQGPGFYTEDGGFPNFLAWLTETTADIPQAVDRFLKFGKHALGGLLHLDPDRDLSNEIADLIGPCNASKSSLPVLTMGRDKPTGRMWLDGNSLQNDWNVEQSQELYDRIVETGKRIAGQLGAEYMDNPAYRFFKQVLTAHPLGGCAMGRDKREGVVDSYCQVFDIPDLYVVDGSVMPGPVGPNPALTIAAVAERAASRLV